MKPLRRHLTYANVISSLALFLILSGATAFAAAKISSSDLKTGAVKTAKIANKAVTTRKIAANAVTGAKVKEGSLGEVPSALNAQKLGGQGPSAFVGKSDFLWAIVDEDGALVSGTGATGARRVGGSGDFQVTFDREVANCATEGTATDVRGTVPPQEVAARIVGTGNRRPAAANVVDVGITGPGGAPADPAFFDGFAVSVYC